MSHNNDKPSERSPATNPALDAVSRAASQDRRTSRPNQRLVIRTAENRYGDDYDFANRPDGMDYGWKVVTVNGKPATEQMRAWKANGWKPVPAGRHPEFSGESPDSQAEIERGGLVLCERPMEISQEARQMETAAAKDQVRTQLDRLAGRARATGSERITKLDRKFEPILNDE